MTTLWQIRNKMIHDPNYIVESFSLILSRIIKNVADLIANLIHAWEPSTVKNSLV